jgi:hypothetical protein
VPVWLDDAVCVGVLVSGAVSVAVPVGVRAVGVGVSLTGVCVIDAVTVGVALELAVPV